MFKVSQNINLNENLTRNNDLSLCNDNKELKRVQILHFPNESVPINYNTQFVINKNGIKGNFIVKIEDPHGILSYTTPQIIDTELLGIHCLPTTEGLHKIHIECNSTPISGSPFLLNVVGTATSDDENYLQLPVFKSDASKVTHTGTGLEKISLNGRNEFTIDGSKAGNNILFIGVCGSNGQCDVAVKHLGNNIYNVSFDVNDSEEYLIAVKWGDDHIPGSPFCLQSNIDKNK